MKRNRLVLGFFVGVMLMLLAGCNTEDENVPAHIDGPETRYEYGYKELCTDGDKYLQITSFKICSAEEAPIYKNEDGYIFLVLGVETNLTEEELGNAQNDVEIWMTASKAFKLRFCAWDEENGQLIYQIPINESAGEAVMYDLKPADGNAGYPVFYLVMDCFDHICTVGDANYCGRMIVFNLQ